MRVPKPFGQRLTYGDPELEPKIKYFLAFEGDQTEYQYFVGVAEFRRELGISALFKIIPMKRNYGEVNWSHPCKFIKPLIKRLEESSTGQMSVESVVKYSVNYLIDGLEFIDPRKDNPDVLSEKLYAGLSEVGYDREMNVDNKSAVLGYVCKILYSEFPESYADKMLDDLQNYINYQELYYNPGFDRVCLIIDRDEQNFRSEQYNALSAVCSRRNFSLYVSNPCFELWILMHFPVIHEIDRNKMYENRKVTRSKRFLEGEVKKELPKYRKNNLPFKELLNKVDDAIVNEQLFCEEPGELEFKLGSNIGLLMRELKKG